MVMKLNIRSDKLNEIQAAIDSGQQISSAFLGRLTSRGFQTYVNNRDHASIADDKRVNHGRAYMRKVSECNVRAGFIKPYDVLVGLGPVEEGEDEECYIISIANADIIIFVEILDIQVHFRETPRDIKDLLRPIATIYDCFSNIPQTGRDVSTYRDKEGKSITKTVTREIVYLSPENLPSFSEYAVAPMYRGDISTLIFEDGSVTLLNNDTSYALAKGCDELDGTVLVGDWYGDSFTAYDTYSYKGKNVSGNPLHNRISYLKNVHELFPECRVVSYMDDTDLASAVSRILAQAEGVLFVPLQAHYKNTRTYKYYPVNRVSIDFNVEHSKNPYDTYMLTTLDNEPFVGTDEFPLHNSGRFPLDREYRYIIGWPHGETFELSWDSNTFVPLGRSIRKPSSSQQARNAWNYLHNPVPLEMIVRHLL
jgi:hypothetical protein